MRMGMETPGAAAGALSNSKQQPKNSGTSNFSYSNRSTLRRIFVTVTFAQQGRLKIA
jgi:hypothetical protein